MTTATVQPSPVQSEAVRKAKMILLGIALIIGGALCIYLGSQPEPPLPCVHVTSYTDYHGPNPICQ